MSVRLHDTLSGETRPLVPLRDGHVGIYSCGPTVYGPVHIGNFRSFLFVDLLVRHLRWRGLTVTWVMNITDVDDKIIRGAAATGEAIDVLADRYLERFLADAAALRMTVPDVLPRATEHIDQMVALIATLLERGHAYRTDDGSIFFRIASWPAYGRLARLDPEGLRVGERVEADEYGKDDVRDFALWKGPKPGEPSWETAIGPGRPGWHIECSAMSMAHLGQSFDIHTGGVDLIFPHHEDEIAQSEAATGQTVRADVAALRPPADGRRQDGQVDRQHRPGRRAAREPASRRGRSGSRSSRSTTGRASATPTSRWPPRRPPSSGSTRSSRRFRRTARMRPDDPTLPGALAAARDAFGAALDDDLNVSAALAALFDLVRELNRRIERRTLSTADAACALDRLRDLDQVLAILPEPEPGLDGETQALLDARAAARAARDWAASDRLRDELAARGVAVEDTRDGQRWRRLAEATRG